MRLLAIDTATEACSAALWLDGELLTRCRREPRRHAELILPLMQELLDEAGIALAALDALAFGRGPGSFTGVRIATGVVQGAALGAGLPVVPVSTLATLAQGALRRHGRPRVLAAFDARMGELYWGIFERDDEGLMRPLSGELVAPATQVPLPAEGEWFGAGSGWQAGGNELAARLGPALAGSDPTLVSDARDLAPLAVRGLQRGEAVAAERVLPVYLRDRVANPPPRTQPPPL